MFVRENASWKPWCAGAITVNEMGATCKKAAVFKKGEEVFEYNYVDYFHQNKVRKLLSKRHAYCRKNVDDPICEARGSGSSWGASFNPNASSLFKKEPEENKPSWNFHCSQSSQGPTYERKDFHVLPLSEYIDMHLPKIGDCLAPYIRPLIFGFSNKVSGTGGFMFRAW